MKIKTFKLTPESILSTSELSSLTGGEIVFEPKPFNPDDIIVRPFPCDNA